MSQSQAETNLLGRVLRGEAPASDLRQLDILVRLGSGDCVVYNPRQLKFSVELRDLALGLLNSKGNFEAQKKWASFISAASSIYEFSFGDNSDADVILDAIWKLSFGEKVDFKVFELAEKLVA